MSAPGSVVTRRNSTVSRLEPNDSGRWFVAGLAERGPTDTYKISRNMQQYVRNHGSRTNGTLLYDAAETYFREGGSELVVGRVFGPSPTYSTVNLSDGSGTTLVVKAKTPGAWGANLQVVIATGTVGGTFTIGVKDTGVLVEQSGDLADNVAALAWAANSDYITLTNSAGADPTPGTFSLTGGTDDRSNATDATWAAALALMPADLGSGQVSMVGRTTTQAYLDTLNAGAASNRVALLDGADTHTVATLTAAATAIKAGTTNEEYGGLFAPWAIVPGITPGTTRTVPWSAVVAGHCARNASLGLSPNVAAAGVNGEASDWVLGLSQAAWTDTERNTLNLAGVNVAKAIRGVFQTYGFRSLVDSTLDDTWVLLSNVRLDMEIRAKASQIADRFEFAEVDGRRHTFSRFGSQLTDMLKPYFEAGSLYGDSFEQACFVDVGPQVNTLETIDNKEINAAIVYRSSPYGEQVRIDVSKIAITEAI